MMRRDQTPVTAVRSVASGHRKIRQIDNSIQYIDQRLADSKAQNVQGATPPETTIARRFQFLTTKKHLMEQRAELVHKLKINSIFRYYSGRVYASLDLSLVPTAAEHVALDIEDINYARRLLWIEDEMDPLIASISRDVHLELATEKERLLQEGERLSVEAWGEGSNNVDPSSNERLPNEDWIRKQQKAIYKYVSFKMPPLQTQARSRIRIPDVEFLPLHKALPTQKTNFETVSACRQPQIRPQIQPRNQTRSQAQSQPRFQTQETNNSNSQPNQAQSGNNSHANTSNKKSSGTGTGHKSHIISKEPKTVNPRLELLKTKGVPQPRSDVVEYWTWFEKAVKVVQHKHQLESFPNPPEIPCDTCDVATNVRRICICKCNIKLAVSKRMPYKSDAYKNHLRRNKLMWHPDRWHTSTLPRCIPSYRIVCHMKASELFVIYNDLLNELEKDVEAANHETRPNAGNQAQRRTSSV